MGRGAGSGDRGSAGGGGEAGAWEGVDEDVVVAAAVEPGAARGAFELEAALFGDPLPGLVGRVVDEAEAIVATRVEAVASPTAPGQSRLWCVQRRSGAWACA